MIVKTKQAADVSSTSSEERHLKSNILTFGSICKFLTHTQIKKRETDTEDELTLYISTPVATLKTSVVECEA